MVRTAACVPQFDAMHPALSWVYFLAINGNLNLYNIIFNLINDWKQDLYHSAFVYVDHDDRASSYSGSEWNLAGNSCCGTDGVCIVRFYVLKI